MTTFFEARDVSRRYGATRALDGVDFAIHAGSVNVLIGENGAGKSTLMKIVAGVERPDGGRLLLDGTEVRFDSVRAASDAGIAIVHQELNLCPNLTVRENIFLGRNVRRAGLIDDAAERERTAELIARFGQTFTPDTLLAELRIGQQQIVEIARTLLHDVRILILDEPTSALSQAEVDTLFALIRELKERGVAIVYISHRLDELLRIGDHFTVLRDGRQVASAEAANVSLDWIIDRMLGDARQPAAERRECRAGATVLDVRDVSVPKAGGGYLVDGVSAAFRAGEVCAVYGLLGSGRTELFEAIAGVRRDGSGSIRVGGRELGRETTARRARRGLRLVSEDRQREGLFANLSVAENLGISSLAAFAAAGILRNDYEESEVTRMATRLGVKSAGLAASVTSLSGGNQQKVVLGRAMLPGPKVLLIDEPGRGVDIGARTAIFEQLRALAEADTAVVFATSDLHEALTAADRILVLARGRLSADLRAADADEADLVRACNQTAAPDALAAAS